MAEELDRRPEEHWQYIAREVEQEGNPTRIRTLARELNEAMLREQRCKVAQKLGLMRLLSDEGKLIETPHPITAEITP